MVNNRHIKYIGIFMGIPAKTDLLKSAYIKRKTENAI